MNFEISQPTECLQRYLIISGHASFGQEVFWNLPLSLDWRLHLIRMYVCNKKTERYVVSMRRPNTFHNNDLFRQLALKDSPPFFAMRQKYTISSDCLHFNDLKKISLIDYQHKKSFSTAGQKKTLNNELDPLWNTSRSWIKQFQGGFSDLHTWE